MESLNQLIERFVTPICNDSSYGSGDGSGCGCGGINSSGCGRGCGCGSDYGCGYGCGSDYGCGYGYGYGYGCGSGDGCGSGYDNGYDNGGLILFNNEPVYYVDGIPMIISKVHGNLAKGYVINNDLTTIPCYIVKHDNLFAHGHTVKEAESALSDKIFDNMDVDEKIDAFLKKFNLTDKYPAKDFYEWHHKLTGSCEFGRNQFIRNHSIDIENGVYTVQEFIDITKNDFGSSVIKQLEERIKSNK